MTDEVLQSIDRRLMLLIKAILRQQLEGKTRAEQVTLLESMDVEDENIAEVLGISRANLRAIRSSREAT